MKEELREMNLVVIEGEHARDRAHELGSTVITISYQLGEGRTNYWLKRQAQMLALAREKRLNAEAYKEKAAAAMAESKQLTNEAAKMAEFLSSDVVEGQWELSGKLFGSVAVDKQWVEDVFGPVPESMMPLDPYRRDAIFAKLKKEGQVDMFSGTPASAEGGEVSASDSAGAPTDDGEGDAVVELDAPDGDGESLLSDSIPWGDDDPDSKAGGGAQGAATGEGVSLGEGQGEAVSAPASKKGRRVLARKAGGELQEVTGNGGMKEAIYVG